MWGWILQHETRTTWKILLMAKRLTSDYRNSLLLGPSLTMSDPKQFLINDVNKKDSCNSGFVVHFTWTCASFPSYIKCAVSVINCMHFYKTASKNLFTPGAIPLSLGLMYSSHFLSLSQCRSPTQWQYLKQESQNLISHHFHVLNDSLTYWTQTIIPLLAPK